MDVLGLTGGIGCGKTTVARAFASRGVPVVYADDVGRDVVAKGSEGLAAVAELFGPEVLAPDGSLDRKRVAAIVFGDAEKLAALNAIIHPRVAIDSARRFGELASAGHPFALYEAALLVENASYRAMSALIVVTARPEVQLARAMARDGSTRDEALARIRAQLPLAVKVAAARYVVDNSSTPARLAQRVADLYAELATAYGRARLGEAEGDGSGGRGRA